MAAYVKVLKTGDRKVVELNDVYQVQQGGKDDSLLPFDAASYKKSNPYGIIEGDTVLIVCVLAFGDTVEDLEMKINDKDGKLKRIASSKRLSTGPDTFELKDFKLDAKSAKQERLLDRATAIKTDKVESEKILQTSSNKSKKKKVPVKVKELDSAAIKKSTEQDDKSILSKARKTSNPGKSQFDEDHGSTSGNSPQKGRLTMQKPSPKKSSDTSSDNAHGSTPGNSPLKGHKPSPKKSCDTSSGIDNSVFQIMESQSKRKQSQNMDTASMDFISPKKARLASLGKGSPKKLQKTENDGTLSSESPKKLQKTDDGTLGSGSPLKSAKTDDTLARKSMSSNSSQKRQHDEEQILETERETYVSCGNDLCQSQIAMATKAMGLLTEKNEIFESELKHIKKELKTMKDILIGGTTHGTQTKPRKECKLKSLKDVNKDDSKEYTIPEDMVHVGDGRFINIVDVAKLESIPDFRGRLAGLAQLYWPGKEMLNWSLSGKRGQETVNRITHAITAGMAEILRATKWSNRKKVNLSDESVHRNLSRVLSENKEKYKDEKKEEKQGKKKGKNEENKEKEETQKTDEIKEKKSKEKQTDQGKKDVSSSEDEDDTDSDEDSDSSTQSKDSKVSKDSTKDSNDV